MAVIYTPHFMQFFDSDGEPLAGGKLYTYEAGTTTPKATFTTQAGDVQNDNPIILDSAGRATLFLVGSYKFTLTNSADVVIKTTDNITAFTATDAGSITNANLADMIQATIKGRAAAAGTGSPQDLTPTQVRTAIEVSSTSEMNAAIAAARSLPPLLVKTANNSPTLDFDSDIDDTYDTYLFDFVNLVPVADDVGLYIRGSVAGTFLSGASDYAWRKFITAASTNDAADNQIFPTLAGSTAGISNVASEGGLCGWIVLYNPSSTTQQKLVRGDLCYTQASAAGDVNYSNFSGKILTTSAVDGIRVFMSSDNIASGTVRMYGLKK